MCSNGWDEVTASLQLVAHLDGEALNVALLVPESQRILPGVLLKTLSAHYASPVNNEHDETSTGFDVVENLMKTTVTVAGRNSPRNEPSSVGL